MRLQIIRVWKISCCTFLLILFAALRFEAAGQVEYVWDLKSCISYALGNNIGLRKSKLDSNKAVEEYLLAKSARLPDLSSSAGYSLSRSNGSETFSTGDDAVNQSLHFSLNSDVTLYKGGAISATIRGKELGLKEKNLKISEIEIDIILSVITAYLQVLYAKESEKNVQQTLNTSEAQFRQIEQKYSLGSASIVDLSTIRSQLAGDRYALVVAGNNLNRRKLELKQILELGDTVNFSPVYPDIADTLYLPGLSPFSEVYQSALSVMPQIQASDLEVAIAELEVKKSVAARIPSLTASGGISSQYSSRGEEDFQGQLSENVSPSAGLQVSFPIFDRRKIRTALNQAEIELERIKLSREEAKKSLYQTIELAWYNALEGVNRYEAAREKMDAAEKRYELASRQFELGMLNSTEILIEKNEYFKSQNEFTQAKFDALLHHEILNVYQGKPLINLQ